MACCITENVSVQLFTCNCHVSEFESVQTLSSQTFTPVKGSTPSKSIQVYLDTGDSAQIRQGRIVIGSRQTRAPHYDTFKRRNPLADITFLSTTSTLVARAQCGFQSCKNVSTNSGVFKIRNRQETKSWCSSHKWCSYHRRFELLGPCGNRKKTYAKVSSPYSSHYFQ